MTRKKFFFALFIAIFPGNVGSMSCAAQTVRLSVDSLFRLIDERSRVLKLKSLCMENAKVGKDMARDVLLPQINTAASIGYLGNGYLTSRDFGNGMKIRNPHSNNNFAVEAMQVIYGGGALSGNIQMAELNAQLSKLNLEESRESVRFLLLGWLIDLQCQHNRRRVIDENIRLARQVIDDMRTRYDEGVALQNDITRYELQLQELQLQREKTAESIRTTDFRMANALGFPAADTEFIPVLPPMDVAAEIKPENDWQRLALVSNLTLQKAKIGIDISETNRRIVAADKRPRISLFAFGRFDSPIVTEVPVLNKNFMYWGFGATMSFNLSSLYTANRRIRRANLSEQESREAYNVELEHVQNDIQSAYEKFRTAETEVRMQEKHLKLARQNYDVVSHRFNNGMTLITDIVDAANVRLSSEIGLENARTMLLFHYYRLKYITHTL